MSRKGFNIYQRAEIFGRAASEAEQQAKHEAHQARRASMNGNRPTRKIPPVHSQGFWNIVQGQLELGSTLVQAKSMAYRITREPRAGLDSKRHKHGVARYDEQIEEVVAHAFGTMTPIEEIVTSQFGPEEERYWL